MGTINKYSNLYNKDNTVIKSVNNNGILTDYSIKELEELVDTLEDGERKTNAISMLQKMYADPKTEADKKYVAELRNELLEKLKASTSTKKEEVTRALGEVDKEVSNDDEYVEPISETPINEDLPDGMLNQIKREYKYTTHTGEETAKQFEKIIEEDSSSNKMDNDIRQAITDRENNKL